MSARSGGWAVLAYGSPYLLVLVLFGLGAAAGRAEDLPDADCYMRLHRVESLHGGQSWYDGSVPRSNAPSGATLHWTRPLDALLLLGAAAGSAFVSFRPALLASGAVVSPLLEVLALLALSWGLRPVLGRPETLLVQVLFVLSAPMMAYFGLGRADHHSLLLLLFVVALGLGVRVVTRPLDRRTALVAGLAVALMVWVSVEGLLALALLSGVLAVLWVLDPGDVLRKSLVFHAGVVAGLAAAVLLEHAPAGWLAPEYDRVSVVHLAAAGLLALAWVAIACLAKASGAVRTAPSRATALGAAGVAAAGLLWLLYPDFFRGASAWLDPRLAGLWEANVEENQPAVGTGGGPLVAALRLISVLPCLLGLAWIPAALAQWRTRPAGRGWLLLAGAAILFGAMGILRIRWAGYAVVALLPFHVSLFFRLVEGAHRRLAPLARAGATLGLVVLFVFAGLLALVVRARVDAAPASAATGPACSLREMCRALEEDPAFAAPRVVLADVDDGPEILWRTRHAVVGTPSHRNPDGILDTYRAFSSHDPEVARAIVRSRGIRLVLVRRTAGSPTVYRRRDGRPSFYEQLESGLAPPWLRPVPLRAPLSDCFSLFESDA